MVAYQLRLLAERDELEGRLERLLNFMGGEAYRALPEAERARLQRQRQAMREYFEVLGERIAALTP